MKYATIVAVALAASPAFADGPQPATQLPAVAEPSIVDWSGAYAGVAIGKVNGASEFCQENFRDTCGANPTNVELPAPAPNGNAFGVQLGYNWQKGKAVFGVEFDYSKLNVEGVDSSTADYGCGFIDECVTVLNSAMSLRGRIGFAAGKFLPFATAGLSRVEVEAGFYGLDPVYSSTHTISMPVVGLGAEYLIKDNISVKGEVLSFLDNGNQAFAPDGICGGQPCGANAISATLVRFGVNMHF